MDFYYFTLSLRENPVLVNFHSLLDDIFMVRQLKVDRAIYLVDYIERIYRYYRKNPHWQLLDPKQNAKNKKSLHGFTRILRNEKIKVFQYKK